LRAIHDVNQVKNLKTQLSLLVSVVCDATALLLSVFVVIGDFGVCARVFEDACVFGCACALLPVSTLVVLCACVCICVTVLDISVLEVMC